MVARSCRFDKLSDRLLELEGFAGVAVLRALRLLEGADVLGAAVVDLGAK